MNKITVLFTGFILVLSANANSVYPPDYLPVEINNKTQKSDSDIYVIIKAMDITTEHDCFIDIDQNTGIGQCTPVTPGMNSESYSYPLSTLPLSEDSRKRLILVPKTASGRIYFSAGYPMDLFVTPDTRKILDPDGFKPRDSNYYTLYDKIEYSYNDGGSWVNPTAVDFFSLPIHIRQEGSTSDVTEAGFSEDRNEVINSVRTLIQEKDTTRNKIWDRLFITYSESGQTELLRIVSPGKAMVENVADTKPFDLDYLSNESVYDFSYMDHLWQYYQTHTLLIDTSEIASHFSLDNYLFTGKVTGEQFVFTNQTGSYRVVIDRPTHSTPFFAGSGDSFDAANNTPKAIIIRQLTSAFDAGLLPAKSGTKIDRHYFQAMKANFYQKNPLLPQLTQGPWYDLYSKALHHFDASQAIYTFAYDDALGQDGTLHDPNAGNISPVQITLGSLENTLIPNPYEDTGTYTVTPVLGFGTTVKYNGAILQNNVPLRNVKIPFHVTINGQDAYLYFKKPVIRPYFDGADGIAIHKTSDRDVEVVFPGK
ncbi:beta-1,3-glucanase family protein [Legionella spiritensis]|uniref:beta-1,3-glucanase family protein n=1 Tax=Legionella spiritensis TaxID=452 RepID=UPI000F6FDE63|nr:beta-1,3-glucanase family protein [Legionella spiritensis]VEG90118.1 Glucan endo-1,3-beta-glucosidase precursor [Legionella spiritensis]